MISQPIRDPNVRIAPLVGSEVLPPLESKTKPTAKVRPSAKEAKGSKPKRPTGERFQTINAFVDMTLRDLDRNELAVWLLLWRDTKPNGLAKTSQTDLAKRAGVSTRTVERAVRRLLNRGLLQLSRRGGVNRGPSTYRVVALPPGWQRT